MRKQKARAGGELVFSSPFSLRSCEKRLLNKAKDEKNRLAVQISRISLETSTFHLSRSSIVVNGRLDMLQEHSTLVSMTADIGRFTKVVFLLTNFVLLATYAIWTFRGSGLGLSVLPGTFLMVILWMLARVDRNALARQVEHTLCDRITDIPDFLDAEVGADGELVPAPSLQAAHHDSPQDLDDLLKRDG